MLLGASFSLKWFTLNCLRHFLPLGYFEFETGIKQFKLATLFTLSGYIKTDRNPGLSIFICILVVSHLALS